MGTNRRSFLRWLGIGAAATPLAAAGKVIGVDLARPGSDRTAYRFQCTCGDLVIAETPSKIGTIVDIVCHSCERTYRMLWTGKSWTLNERNPMEVRVTPLSEMLYGEGSRSEYGRGAKMAVAEFRDHKQGKS